MWRGGVVGEGRLENRGTCSIKENLISLNLLYLSLLKTLINSTIYYEILFLFSDVTILQVYLLSTCILLYSIVFYVVCRANVAAAAGGIIFFILYLPYTFMVVWEETLESTTKILSVDTSINLSIYL